MDWFVGLIGALIGGAGAFGGVLFSAHSERRRQRLARTAQQQVAARAWRDDLYDMQTRLAEAVRDRRNLGLLAIDEGRLGQPSDFLVLAEALLGYREWSGIARTRREVVGAQVRVLNGSKLEDAEMIDLYWRIQQSREALALVDTDWQAGLHGMHEGMGDRPSRYRRINF